MTLKIITKEKPAHIVIKSNFMTFLRQAKFHIYVIISFKGKDSSWIFT